MSDNYFNLPEKLVLVITNGDGHSRATKRQLQEAINQILPFVPDYIGAKNVVASYFIPQAMRASDRKAALKSRFHWVDMAIDESDNREFCHYGYSDGTDYVATDGSRMHLAHCVNIPEGYYKDGQLVSRCIGEPMPDRWRNLITPPKSGDALSRERIVRGNLKRDIKIAAAYVKPNLKKVYLQLVFYPNKIKRVICGNVDRELWEQAILGADDNALVTATYRPKEHNQIRQVWVDGVSRSATIMGAQQ